MRMVYASDRVRWSARDLQKGYLHQSSDVETLRFRDTLINDYHGLAIEDVFNGREVRCSSGSCYAIESRNPISLGARERERATAAILCDISLIRGIGPATRQRLEERGYRTVPDLLGHPRYRREAGRLLDLVAGGDTRELVNWIERRHRQSDPLLLEASRFHAPEDFAFLDIETLGLSSRPIILIGLGRVERDSIVLRQYLLRSIEEETAALAAVLPDLEAERTALVTFNGRAFDLPYIRDRLTSKGIPATLDLPHFDLLRFSRRRWRGYLPSCRLGSLETAVLNITRTDDLPSAMVPEFYETYLRTGNPGPLIPIVEHNRQDIISLARLFALLRGDDRTAATEEASIPEMRQNRDEMRSQR